MSDIVTLNGYKIKDEKAIRSYDTVASMKADTKLKEGYHVKTEGYYEANDGGHGEYIIVDDDTLVDDGGLIHVLTNGLRAELIINDKINIKQLGAKGNGIEDDSNVFNKIKSIDYTEFYIPKGKYLISNTIDLVEVNGKHIYGSGKEGGHNNNNNSSIILGNTGNNPIFNLLGALCINIENLNITSNETLTNPSTLAILQGVTQTSQYSQYIEFTKLYIDLIHNKGINDNYGSIGIYNWQSELNSYEDLFIYADTPAFLIADDILNIATNNGGIRPTHDSMTGNHYSNLELQSKNNYALVLSGSGLNFNSLYLQKSLLLLPNQNQNNQNNNIFIQGIIENTETPIILKDNAKLGGSNIQLHSVGGKTLISGTGIIEKSSINISGSFVTDFSESTIRFSRCILFRNGKINNIYSQGNIILNNDSSEPTANNNVGLSMDGTIWYNGKAIYTSINKPTRTDLPDGSIVLNAGSNFNLLAWKYKENETTWLPMGISKPVESDTGSISNITPLFIGELLHNISDNSMWISYGTEQGNWKQITN